MNNVTIALKTQNRNRAQHIWKQSDQDGAKASWGKSKLGQKHGRGKDCLE
jgi:hypothetical protein